MNTTAVDAGCYKLASVLLQYPTRSLFDGLDLVEETASRIRRKQSRAAMTRFVRWLQATPPEAVARHYVETFDLRRRCAPYLTYFRYGDTRKRGMAMLTFKTAYRTAGFTPSEDDLPDYVPLVLEFAALCTEGQKLLRAHRADLELFRRALERSETPYLDVVEAVCAQLPGLGRHDLAAVAKAWEAGPPSEEVGLEPFAPPGYLDGSALPGYKGVQ